MTKEEILEELDRIDWQVKELASEHNYYCDMLQELEEQEKESE
jgi:hypothetical protein